MQRLATVAVAALAAIGIVAPPAAATPDPALPDGVEVRFGDDVPVATRWHLSAGIERAWATFAPGIEDPASFAAVIVVVTNAEDAAAAWADERGISLQRARDQFTARSSNYAGLATGGLTVIIADGAQDAGVAIHEFVHLVQHHVAGDTVGPRWIAEGAAEWFRQEVEHRWGISAESPRDAFAAVADEWETTLGACELGLVPSGAETCVWATEPLRSLERGAPFDIGGGAVSAYARSSVAFQFLVEDAGVDGYLCFLREQGGGADWADAFRTCTGGSVASFYRSFDLYRAHGFVHEIRGPPQRFL